MWQAQLRENYKNFAEFKHYSDAYGISKRLGFDSAREAWDENPLIEGSCNPEDLKVVKQYCRIRKDLVKQGEGVPISLKDDEKEEVKEHEIDYVFGAGRREYRWLHDTTGFQIKYKGKWYYAYSIDFEF